MTTVPQPLICGVALLLLAAFAPPLHAQVVPGTPRDFPRRDIGGTPGRGGIETGPGDIGGSINPNIRRDQTVTTARSYIVLTEERTWTSTDGQEIVARVIAWQESVEQFVHEGRPGDEPPAPTNFEVPDDFVPEVVRDNKIRIMRGQQVFELPIDRLSKDDQDFVKQLDQAVKNTAARRRAAMEEAAREAAMAKPEDGRDAPQDGADPATKPEPPTQPPPPAKDPASQPPAGDKDR